MMVGRTLGELFPKQAVEPGEVVLEVEGLGVEGSFSGVSFQLRRGEILGMAGLIGAGRTNVARALFGTEPATAGTIKLDGKPVTIKSPDAAMALGIGYVPEDRKEHGLVLTMSIADNVTLPVLSQFARLGWLTRAASARRPLAVGPATGSEDGRRGPEGRASYRAATSRRSCSPSGWAPSRVC